MLFDVHRFILKSRNVYYIYSNISFTIFHAINPFKSIVVKGNTFACLIVINNQLK